MTEQNINLALSGLLQDQVVLVTGASRGIGKSVAQLLAMHGAYVYGTATSSSGAQNITEYLNINGQQQGEGLILNVTDDERLKASVEYIMNSKGKIDILVNNAGITKDGLSMRMKYEDWQNVIDTNLSAVFKLIQLVTTPMMKARKGNIINITSIIAATGNAGQSNYCASKAGVVGYSKSIARELGSRGIRVNCIAPGFIETDMTDVLSDEQKKTLQQKTALGKLGSTNDIANAVLFLASDMASYITGSVLHVNGGMYMNS
jgi:3-oxoacyl-[acyl-carrier protein] reductase